MKAFRISTSLLGHPKGPYKWEGHVGLARTCREAKKLGRALPGSPAPPTIKSPKSRVQNKRQTPAARWYGYIYRSSLVTSKMWPSYFSYLNIWVNVCCASTQIKVLKVKCGVSGNTTVLQIQAPESPFGSAGDSSLPLPWAPKLASSTSASAGVKAAILK